MNRLKEPFGSAWRNRKQGLLLTKSNGMVLVDTCPQGNLSFFYDNNYYGGQQTNVKDMLLPYLVPGLGKATRVAAYVGETNQYFSKKNNFYIPSSEELYLLLSQLITAISQTTG